jgi:Protein of unknown function (DUF1571)
MMRVWRGGSRSSKRSGFLAALTFFAAPAFLYLNFEPAPAGADRKHRKVDITRLVTSIEAVPKPAATPVVSTPVNGPADAKKATVAAGPSEFDRIAMLMNLVLLEQGRRRLADVPDYTCTFFKQERLGTELSDGQIMELKMRHKPFSVYMKWLNGEKGRELLYVDGEQDNKMIVHPGGWKSRIVPAIKLEPDSSLALAESRHPVTMVGLLKLSDEIITRRKSEIERKCPLRVQFLENETANDRPCYCFVATYLDRKTSEEYRKSIQYIDREWLLPICVKNFAWPDASQKFANDGALDEATLVEHYAYTELQLNQQLANDDFDRANKSYNFRR